MSKTADEIREDLIAHELKILLQKTMHNFESKLTINYFEDFGTMRKCLSINHNNLSLCRLDVDSIATHDMSPSQILDKCAELLAGILLHNLLIKVTPDPKQIEGTKCLSSQ